MQLEPQFLPDLRTIRHRAMALAMLDAIICPESEYRYFSFDAAWAEGEQLASMRNGDGDHWYLHLSDAGAAIKGYVQELPGAGAHSLALEVQRRVPSGFAPFVEEPAFAMEAVSFFYWRRSDERSWTKLAQPEAGLSGFDDGSADYLSILLAPASCYYDYACDYFECELPMASIEHIYRHAPLTGAIAKSLNPRLSLAQAQASAAQIGYPRVRARASLAC